MTQNDPPASSETPSLARVLVPLDGSNPATQALPFAAAIAGRSAGAEIILLEVTPPATNVRNVLGREIAPAARVQEGYAQVAGERLDAAAATLPSGISAKTLVATGDPVEEILRAADAERVDLIAMTASGGGAWGPFAYGRVVDRVVRAATRPVLVVPPRSDGGGRIGGGTGGNVPSRPDVTGILVPIDGSAAALPVAAALAATFGVAVRVVQAVPSGAGTLPPLPEIAHPDTIEREFRSATHATATAAVADAVARLEALGATATGDVLAGRAVATVISEAGRTDLVVLTGQGQGQERAQPDRPDRSDASAAARYLGGVADKLIRAGVSPVVLVPGAANRA